MTPLARKAALAFVASALAGGVLASAASPGAGAPSEPVSPAGDGPLTPGAAQERLRRLSERLLDSQRKFSLSETFAEIDLLEKAAGAQEAGRVAWLRFFLNRKARRPAQALRYGEAALEADAENAFLSPERRALTAYQMAEIAEDSGDCAKALVLWRRAGALMADRPEFSQSQKLGVEERIGYCQHELKQFSQARAQNEQALAAGEKAFGPDSGKLVVVLANLAQNLYELKDMPGAQRYLERALTIARRERPDRVDNLLFQLGVLAHETGRPKEALAYMAERLALAERGGDPAAIAEARDALEVLREKQR